MSAGYQGMQTYGQAYPQPGGQQQQRGGYARQMGPAYPQQQQVQPSFKGTLAPGTRVQVGNITVTVKKYLSEGGFAHVYLVTTSQPIPMPVSVTGAVGASGQSSTERGETVHVLKRMAVPDKAALADVRREVEVHKLLRNQPNIVHFIEASATALPAGGYEIFILMEYCSGGGIISLMNARLRDRLRQEEVLKIFGDVCSGVAVMHHLDPPLMHRDLKVENILLAPSTDAGAIPGSKSTASNLKATFKLCDFGSAAPVLSRKPAKSMDEVKRIEADLNKHTTLQYRAPEMVDVYQRRVIDEKADIWALGVFLYKLCYYTTPFEENGGGPLAILNVQYRIPPQPAYSQPLKDLINSLLKEHSADRPTIDQVILNVHKLLGTRPPSSAVHYAQQAANGKIATPLPTIVSGARDGFDVTSVATKSHAPATSDLISVGPSKKERELSEAKELEAQKQNITPMRRGRPTKPASDNPAPETVSPAIASTQAAPSPSVTASKWTVPLASSAKPAQPAPLIEGFGDSFVPSPTMTGSEPAPPALPKRPSSGSIRSPSIGKEQNDVTSSNEIKPSVDREYLKAPKAPTPTLSPMRHSPALPGFSAAVTPTASPSPAATTAPATEASAASDPVDGRDELADRFPTLADLDAKYGGTPATRQNSVVVPGAAKRQTVGAMAGRFEKPFEPQQYKSAARHSMLSKSATTSSLPTAEAPSRIGGSGSVLKRWQPPSETRSEVNGSRKSSADWLTGDKDENATTSEVSSRRPVLDRLTKPSSVTSTQKQNGTSAVEPESSDDDDDQAGPEDADATRRPQLSVNVSQTSARTAPVSATKPASLRGKVRAPSWLVEAADSPTRPDRLASPNTSAVLVSPITDPSAADKLDEAAQQAQSQLEELLRGPSSAASLEPERQAEPETLAPAATTTSAPEERAPVRVTAPAWDEDEDDEMKALPRPSMPTRLSQTDKVTTDSDLLVDYSEPTPAKEDTAETVVKPQGRPLVNLMDDDEDEEQQRPSSAEVTKLTPAPPSPPIASKSRVAEVQETEPRIIQPRRPTAVRATRGTGASAGLKPWEREAAMSAAATNSSIVKNTALPSASTSHLHRGEASKDDAGGASAGDSDGFSGVSSLISRWQQSVETNAPGWGRIGSNDGKAGAGHGLGPKVADQAAGLVHSRNAVRRDLTK